MSQPSRREFCAHVGRGMLIAGLGPALAADLGLARVDAADVPDRLTFGPLEPLVSLMQQTPANKLLPVLVERIRQGTDLRQLIAAGALANARTFGGEDYIGFHTIMALAPALRMAQEMPEGKQALPVLKVLYRNTSRIQAGGGNKEILRPVEAATVPEGKAAGQVLLDAVRRKDLKAAEGTFAAVAARSADEAFNELLHAVQDGQEVHRIVLPYRAWDLLDIVGREHAHTLLRQSVHYCVKQESPRYNGYFAKSRAILPKLMEQHKLLGKPLGTKTAEDAWVDQLSQTIFKGPPEQAAEAVAAALAEGFAPEVIGEAITLATNQLVLRDNGRPSNEQANKPKGSCHGDSVGVHACDSANAWRNMAKISNARNTVACLILGAYQACQDRIDGGGDYFLKAEPYPRGAARAQVKNGSIYQAVRQLDEAIKAKDQALASAVVDYVSTLEMGPRPVLNVILRHTVSEDGALHGEKFYRTATEEFAATRPAFRWRHLIALARVTASAYGFAAPGIAEARELVSR